MTPLSFLLGAGFSKPAGYPLASEINSLFVGLKEGDFTIHTDGSAWFHGGKPNPNDWFMRKEERVFAERLLNHYCRSVVTQGTFHYETFYDWLKDLRSGRKDDAGVEAIAQDLARSSNNLILNFDLTFNQLLAQPLSRWPSEVHLCRGLPRSHARFLDLVEALSEDNVLHFHSLNHDLFFESLSSTDAIQGELADGFSDLGSPFFGRLRRVEDGPNGEDPFSYTVRLPQYTGVFGSRFNLYKLHGSVDQYVFHDDEQTTIKTKRGIGPNDFMKEVADNGSLRYESDFGNYHPDFLSGTTYKTLRYDSTPYYRSVFSHFEINLSQSPALICIGYGFGDSEINRRVSEHLLSRSDTRIVVVDITQPNVPPEFLDRLRYVPGGVSNFDYNDLVTSLEGL